MPESLDDREMSDCNPEKARHSSPSLRSLFCLHLVVLSLGLFKAGYEVHYAFNGKEGYETILSLHPNLILLDLMMPILAGTDVLKLVADNVMIRDIPIIVLPNATCTMSQSLM